MKRSVRLARAVTAAILLGVLAVPVALADQADPTGLQLDELERRSGAGEQCIVCGQAIHGDEIVEVRYKGRSFFVAASMLGDLQDDPDVFFLKLQARSALFDERSMEGRAMSNGWLLFGLYMVVGLVCAAICGYLAIGRSLAPLPWFFAGLVGNVAALVVLLVTPRGDATAQPAGVPAGFAKVPLTHSPASCPGCGATNHPTASSCGGCGRRLTPAFESETARV